MGKEFTVFSDESHVTASVLRSIASVSLPTNKVDEVNCEIKAILENSNVEEFKWHSLKSAKYRFAAEKIISQIIRYVGTSELRIDTLIWNTSDNRHKIKNRDDIANFERMYFHLLKNIFSRREIGSSWHVYPDERVDVDWETVDNCLKNVGKWKEILDFPILNETYIIEKFNVSNFKQICSAQEPLCQVADLFAGMAVYSFDNYAKYKTWQEKNVIKQLSLFESETESSEERLSGSDKERLPMLHLLKSLCSGCKLGVSIDQKQGFWTPNPGNPINFWSYVPQHEKDKAPVRS